MRLACLLVLAGWLATQAAASAGTQDVGARGSLKYEDYGIPLCTTNPSGRPHAGVWGVVFVAGLGMLFLDTLGAGFALLVPSGWLFLAAFLYPRDLAGGAFRLLLAGYIVGVLLIMMRRVAFAPVSGLLVGVLINVWVRVSNVFSVPRSRANPESNSWFATLAGLAGLALTLVLGLLQPRLARRLVASLLGSLMCVLALDAGVAYAALGGARKPVTGLLGLELARMLPNLAPLSRLRCVLLASASADAQTKSRGASGHEESARLFSIACALTCAAALLSASLCFKMMFWKTTTQRTRRRHTARRLSRFIDEGAPELWMS